jgi:GGDEF domain-containing protein
MAATTKRPRRFALPDLKDKRADEAIEAFLDGPKTRRRSTSKALAVHADRAVAHSPTGDAVSLRSMPGRLAWYDALDREAHRATRYGRPTAVAIFELRPQRESATIDSWVRTHAAPVGESLLRLSRATDVVARITSTRFQVLLPETSDEDAGKFVERVVGECQARLAAIGAPLHVQTSVAASSADLPLRDAVAQAVRSIEAA